SAAVSNLGRLDGALRGGAAAELVALLGHGDDHVIDVPLVSGGRVVPRRLRLRADGAEHGGLGAGRVVRLVGGEGAQDHVLVEHRPGVLLPAETEVAGAGRRDGQPHGGRRHRRRGGGDARRDADGGGDRQRGAGRGGGGQHGGGHGEHDT